MNQETATMEFASLKDLPASHAAVRPRRKHMFLIPFIATFMLVFLTLVFLAYGPVSYFREEWITKAMGTMNHQWLATMFFDQKTIQSVLAKNKTVDPNQNTDVKQVSVTSSRISDNATQLPTSPADGEHIIDGVGFIKLKGSTYSGWLVKVYNPSRVYMGISSSYGTKGETVETIAQENGAYVGINAGGFMDVGGKGTGGMPDGYFIASGKLMAGSTKASPHSIIGLDHSNTLVLDRLTDSAVKSSGLRDAVEFRPFLIVNGIPAKLYGNGGYGTDPRTAIGQTKSGVLLFVVIDGRSLTSIGATMKDLQDIFERYGAVNAANLDGGASTTLVVNGKVINNPCSKGGARYVPNAFLVSHTAGWKSAG